MVLQKEIFRRRKVRIENRDELPLRHLHPFPKGARLEAFTIAAVVVADRMTQSRVALNKVANDFRRLVRRIIKYLDIHLFRGILQLANAVDQALRDVPLIEHGKLHRNARQLFKLRGRLCSAVLSVLVIQVDQDVAMHPVRRQKNQHDEVRNQERDIKCVRVIEALKRPIEKMLLDIRTNPLRGKDGDRGRPRNERGVQ